MLSTRKIIILTGILWLFTGQIFAQTNQSSVKIEGWRQAKWGMDLDKVLEAFPGEAVKTHEDEKWKAGIALAEITKLDIEHESFEAKFIFEPSTRKLKQIVVQAKKEVKFPELSFVPLEQKLTEKYGKPDFTNDDKHVGQVLTSVTKKRVWKRSPTRIELKYFAMSEISEHLTITYDEVQEGGDKNL